MTYKKPFVFENSGLVGFFETPHKDAPCDYLVAISCFFFACILYFYNSEFSMQFNGAYLVSFNDRALKIKILGT